jgi:hypothetical protein
MRRPGPEKPEVGKPRNKRRFESKIEERWKKKPETEDRIRPRRQPADEDDGDFLDDLDDDFDLATIVDFDELDGFGGGFDFEDDDET